MHMHNKNLIKTSTFKMSNFKPIQSGMPLINIAALAIFLYVDVIWQELLFDEILSGHL